MTAKAKKGLSREQAGELYQDLQRTMAKMLKNEAEFYNARGVKVPQAASDGSKQATAKKQMPASYLDNELPRRLPRKNSGAKFALALVIAFATGKVTLSALEFSGFASVASVEASLVSAPLAPKFIPGQFSKEEVQVLTSLDSRRAELEERSKRLDERELDIARKDKEFAGRITELRELSEKLNTEREKTDQKKSNQLEQLANVYGSMNPEEAAHLMEQLDITIALSLIERMPEKRIGQILALMTPERALALTKMLSGRVK